MLLPPYILPHLYNAPLSPHLLPTPNEWRSTRTMNVQCAQTSTPPSAPISTIAHNSLCSSTLSQRDLALKRNPSHTHTWPVRECSRDVEPIHICSTAKSISVGVELSVSLVHLCTHTHTELTTNPSAHSKRSSIPWQTAYCCFLHTSG